MNYTYEIQDLDYSHNINEMIIIEYLNNKYKENWYIKTLMKMYQILYKNKILCLKKNFFYYFFLLLQNILYDEKQIIQNQTLSVR
jgi:hypothetical protein